MSRPGIMDLAQRSAGVAEKRKKGWIPKSRFHPGGEKGKLHRELGISTDSKIPASRLAAATRSRDPEIRRDAIRAKTMSKWHHGGKGDKRTSRQRAMYDGKE
jgi:hypothetical protein